MFGQGKFVLEVVVIYVVDLWYVDMGFIGKNNGVIWDKFEKCWWWFFWSVVGQIVGIVFDFVVDVGGFQYFQIEICVLFQLLGFQQFVFFGQLFQLCLKFGVYFFGSLL